MTEVRTEAQAIEERLLEALTTIPQYLAGGARQARGEAIAALKADGRGWQTRANALLRKAAGL